MTIRLAAPADAERIAQIADDCWRWAYAGFMPEEVLASLDTAGTAIRAKERIEQGEIVFVAADGDLVLGFAALQEPSTLPGTDLEIGGLYVCPDASRKGVGRALVAWVAEWGIAEGRSKLAIHALRDNVIGRAFYEHIGGRVAAETVWTFRGREYPSLWYVYEDLSILVGL